MVSAGPEAGAQPSSAILPVVWKLIGLRWQITWNGFRRARLVKKIITVIALLTVLALVGFVFWLSWTLLGFLRSPELTQYIGDTQQIIGAVPGLIFAGFFLGILLTSFGVLLQALYLSGDMDFLLAAPIPIRAVFVTKLLQAILPNLSLGVLFGLPILYGLGAAYGYNFLYYPLVVLMFILLSLSAAGLAGLLVMLVVRIFPARRVVEVLGFLGAIMSILCSQSGNLMNTAGEDINVTNEQATQAISLISRLDNPWNPLNWPGRGLLALGEGDLLTGIGLTFISLGLAAGIFWVSLETAERWYYTGWAGMQAVARKKKKVSRAAGPAAMLPVMERLRLVLDRLLSMPVRGIMWKDALMMSRDLRHLSQLVTPLIFGIIYGFMFLRNGSELPAGRGEAPSWFMDSFRTLLSYGNILLSIFVGWMLLQRLGGMGFSAEGKNFWMLKAAPIRARQLLMAKFLVAYLPALALSSLFLLGYSLLQRTDLVTFLYSLLAMAFCLAGMAGLLVAFGAAGANFTWEDPRRMNAGKLGCVGSILAMLFIPLNLALFFVPVAVLGAFRGAEMYGYLAGCFLGAGASLTGILLPMRLLENRVEHLGE